MKCPECNFADTMVLETRMTNDGAVIKRRRECEKCQSRFNTLEKLDSVELMVKKRDNSREPFDKNKIQNGVALACEKRPIKESQIIGLVNRVEEKILDLGSRTISSKEIGEYVMECLKSLDEVAYLRFASVYRSFDNASQFEREIVNLKK